MVKIDFQEAPLLAQIAASDNRPSLHVTVKYSGAGLSGSGRPGTCSRRYCYGLWPMCQAHYRHNPHCLHYLHCLPRADPKGHQCEARWRPRSFHHGPPTPVTTESHHWLPPVSVKVHLHCFDACRQHSRPQGVVLLFFSTSYASKALDNAASGRRPCFVSLLRA